MQRWLRVALLALTGLCPGLAAATLADCRDARHGGGADALATCELAARVLQQTGDQDGAFEALMHSAELATHQSNIPQAQAALDAARRLLPTVHDPLALQRFQRRRGLLAYQQGHSVQALGAFLEALTAANSSEDPQAAAISHNDLGVIYQKLGDVRAALEHFQRSLELKRNRAEKDLAATLANIGSLYRQLDDFPQAERFLQRALAAQLDAGLIQPAARTREELGMLRRAEGRMAAAEEEFDAAWAAYVGADFGRERMRLALRRAELAADASDMTSARDWLQRARGEASDVGRESLLQADLLNARLARSPEEHRAAVTALTAALAQAGGSNPPLIADAFRQLAANHQQLGQPEAALQALHTYIDQSEHLAQVRHSERFDALRVRFDVATLEAERDRLQLERARQLSDIAQVRAHRLGIGVIALLLLGVSAVIFQRRLYRQRLQSAHEHARLQQRIEHARSAAAALRTDVRSMAWLLDQGNTAALVFDAGGLVRAVTPAAAARLGHDAAALTGRTLVDVMGGPIAQWAQTQIDEDSLDAGPPQDAVADTLDPTLHCRRIAREEELGVLTWHDTPAPDMPVADAITESDAAVSGTPSPDAPSPPPDFRVALVRLMQSSLDLWERVTRKTRIDLADASGVWRITVDEGRLRVRAMDRYLVLDTLPERPRWREVLRTAYFVLSDVPLSEEQRLRLEAEIADVQQAAGRRAAG